MGRWNRCRVSVTCMRIVELTREVRRKRETGAPSKPGVSILGVDEQSIRERSVVFRRGVKEMQDPLKDTWRCVGGRKMTMGKQSKRARPILDEVDSK